MSEEAATDAPAEQRTYSHEEYQAVVDESIGRRQELKQYKEVFDGYTSDERDAVLSLARSIRDEPGVAVHQMRDIAWRMANDDAIQVDYFENAPWEQPAASPPEEGTPEQPGMAPNLDLTQIDERVKSQIEEFQRAQLVEEYSRRIDAVGKELGYQKFTDDGKAVTPEWDMLLTLARRTDAASPEEAVSAAHAKLGELGVQRGEAPAPAAQAEHPKTAGAGEAAAAAPDGEEAPARSFKELKADVTKRWMETSGQAEVADPAV